MPTSVKLVKRLVSASGRLENSQNWLQTSVGDLLLFSVSQGPSIASPWILKPEEWVPLLGASHLGLTWSLSPLPLKRTQIRRPRAFLSPVIERQMENVRRRRQGLQ